MDTMPIVQLNLEPPVHPLPKLAHDIGEAEKAREAFEEASFVKLREAFNVALVGARQIVGNAVDRSMRALSEPKKLTGMLAYPGRREEKTALLTKQRPPPAFLAADDKFSVEVHVSPSTLPEPAVGKHVRSIEMQRSELESRLFDQAISDINDLPRLVANELEEQIGQYTQSYVRDHDRVGLIDRQTSFLSASSHDQGATTQQANVQVLASSYPTIESLIQDMQSRRDNTEDLVRARILELEMKFLMALNDLAANTLDAAARRLLTETTKVSKL